MADSKPAIFDRFARWIERQVGSPFSFAIAIAAVVIWAVSGPLFGWSDTWQLVINTGTTIITFLMVFLIQRSQNKDALAVHLKLNELVAAMQGASNRMADVEALSEEELRTLSEHYAELAQLAKRDGTITDSHSVEEARNRHSSKKG